MNTKSFPHMVALLLIGLEAILGSTGCNKSANGDPPPPGTPKEAATQLQQVFAGAPPDVKGSVTVASDALRAADYEKAVQSLQAIMDRQNLTFEQGMAVHQSMVALERQMLSGVASGDASAKRAYELLQKSRRN